MLLGAALADAGARSRARLRRDRQGLLARSSSTTPGPVDLACLARPGPLGVSVGGEPGRAPGPGADRADTTLPLVWDGTRLYLERYWRFENKVATDLLSRATAEAGTGALPFDPGHVASALSPGELEAPIDPLQREAVLTSLSRRIAVIAGGPGTGKTVTISRLLGAAHELALETGRRLSVALAAPTGKAAARMQAAVHEMAALRRSRRRCRRGHERPVQAKTLHRLLGARSDGRTAYDSARRLPHDLVVVDETSMVSLPLMARLLDAVRPDATLVLVGDPYQLASVEAGAVLGDIVGPVASKAARGPLDNEHRGARAQPPLRPRFAPVGSRRRRAPRRGGRRRSSCCAAVAAGELRLGGGQGPSPASPPCRKRRRTTPPRSSGRPGEATPKRACGSPPSSRSSVRPGRGRSASRAGALPSRPCCASGCPMPA